MDKLEAMRVFCSVIEAGSFVGAAEHLGISTTAVSRFVSQLEGQLNVRLLNRTTRRMSPTDEGFAYFERCTQLLADLDEAEASVAGKALRPRGRLRLSAPIALATLRLAPAFAAFSTRHPEITLDIQLSDSVADFAEEGLDMAIRTGRVGSDNLVARLIGETELLIAAAPDYLARAGEPQHPDDLRHHHCFTYSYASRGNQWQFRGSAGEVVDVRIGGPVNSNSGMLLTEMAAAGAGIVQVPSFILAPLLATGRLVRLLPQWQQQRLPIHAVYPTRRHLSAKVQTMVAFLTQWQTEHKGDGGIDSADSAARFGG